MPNDVLWAQLAYIVTCVTDLVRPAAASDVSQGLLGLVGWAARGPNPGVCVEWRAHLERSLEDLPGTRQFSAPGLLDEESGEALDDKVAKL